MTVSNQNAPAETTLPLNDGTSIPALGLGFWQVAPEDCAHIIRTGIEAGYRHFDDAAIYKNEEAVGAALAEELANKTVSREDIYVVSKLWNDDQGKETTREACEKTLERLGLDYLDLYLIHWPCPQRSRFIESFEVMAELREEGLIRSIGVSNFYSETLEELIQATGIIPVLNQIELHPGFNQDEVQPTHEKYGILTECWSPLGQGKILETPELVTLAEKYEVSPAQIALRWNLQQGRVVLPRSKTPERIRSNAQIFHFELTEQEMASITQLGSAEGRIGPDPRFYPDAV